ncbi:SCO family protein [Microbulbifer epialgicus]|uniref:SCO family protein n=1 Tax=Microbulbifer epialgicus TaxID=393907 RepID=A0ABV4P6V6_9GAMM
MDEQNHYTSSPNITKTEDTSNKYFAKKQISSTTEIVAPISITYYVKIIFCFFNWNLLPCTPRTSDRKNLHTNSLQIKILFASFMALVVLTHSSWSLAELPNDSVYHVESSWLDQNGSKLNISELQGKVQIISFVYTYCEHSCPVILANLRQIEKQIPTSEKLEVQFSLISLDPERDSPDLLRHYMQKNQLNECRWLMLNGDPDDVLELSNLLGVRYKPMNNKDIAHSNMITVLDKQGKIRYQMKGLNEGLEKVISEISKIVLSDNEKAPPQSLSTNCS